MFQHLIDDIDFDFLFSGGYEREFRPSNFGIEAHPYDFGYNILNLKGLLYHPIVDYQRLENGEAETTWPHNSPFAVCLTHDVDSISKNSTIQRARRLQLAVRLLKKNMSSGSLKHVLIAAGRVALSLMRWGADPKHNFDQWLSAESKAGAKSTFFFMPEHVRKSHFSDGEYRYTDKVCFEGQYIGVAELMREIDRRGWEIGLHATWYAVNDADELKFQKEQIEQVLGHEIESVRHHILHYDFETTPACQAEAGFRFDSTLGFNRNIGFRFGTCHPWQIAEGRNGSPLWEIPLVIQEAALFGNASLSLDKMHAYRYVMSISESVSKVSGVLTLLFHPDAPIIEKQRWELYLDLLDTFQKDGVWMSSVTNIGNHWLQAQNNSCKI